jgi:hypothetical protein
MEKAAQMTSLVNLAFRVSSLSETEAFIDSTEGWEKTAIHELGGDQFLEARFGGVRINFFQTAIYDERADPPPPGFLHASYGVGDLDSMLKDEAWAKSLVWGPEVISGGFGRRRIAFFEPLPGCRVELMEELV